MIDPNRGMTEDVLAKLKDCAYERLRLQLFEAVEKKLSEFGMTWDDLAEKLHWKDWDRTTHSLVPDSLKTGENVRMTVGEAPISLFALNDIAHCFSAEAYIIFRPRFPITQT